MRPSATPFAPVTGYDRWCVPTALSALCGMSTDAARCLCVGACEDADPPDAEVWTGVHIHTIEAALFALGIRVAEVDIDRLRNSRGQRPTVWRWATTGERTPGALREGLYLLVADGHAILYRDGLVVDNGTVCSARRPKHFTQFGPGLKRHRLEAIYAIQELRYHDESFVRLGRYQPPRWALDAAAELERVRAREGRDARIPIAEIRRLRDAADPLAYGAGTGTGDQQRPIERSITR